MNCYLCQEEIGSGEACIPERINNSAHYWFFHPGCYTKVQDERKKTEERARILMAGYTS